MLAFSKIGKVVLGVSVKSTIIKNKSYLEPQSLYVVLLIQINIDIYINMNSLYQALGYLAMSFG